MQEGYSKHQKVMREFLKYANKKQPGKFVLKGGAALTICYGVDRITNDLDFDGKGGNIIALVKDFCNKSGYNYTVKKDTDTTKRCMINYGDVRTPLKVEVSYRRRDIGECSVKVIDGVTAYTLDELAVSKAIAYTSRDKINDVYDIATISTKYAEELSPLAVSAIREAVGAKGLGQFDMVVADQLKDTTINEDILLERFLAMYESIKLAPTEQEVKDIPKIRQKFGRKKRPRSLTQRRRDNMADMFKKCREPNLRAKKSKGVPWLRRGLR